MDILLNGSSYSQDGIIGFTEPTNPRTGHSIGGWVQGQKYFRVTEFNGSSEVQTTPNNQWSSLSTTDFNHHEMIFQNGIINYTVTNPSNTSKTVTLTPQYTGFTGGKLGLYIELFSGATTCYFKNVKVGAL